MWLLLFGIHLCKVAELTVCTFYSTADTMCYIPKEFENGEVDFSDIHLGSTAHYTCNDGYTLVGPATRECLITGTWSGYTPVCVANSANGSKINSTLVIMFS